MGIIMRLDVIYWPDEAAEGEKHGDRKTKKKQVDCGYTGSG